VTAKKDLKRLVRERSRKTGESYTAALRHFQPTKEKPVQPDQGIAFPNRFSKFTDAARRAMAYAQDEAHRLGHSFLGSEHLLLALSWQPTSGAGRVLAASGVDAPRLRAAVEEQLASVPPAAEEIGLTPRLRAAFEAAVEAARTNGQDFVGTAHLLSGLLSEPSAFAVLALGRTGADLPALLAAVGAALPEGDNAPSSPANATYRDLADRLTEDAKRALIGATEEAIRLQHNYIGTEHLLLGLARLPDSAAGRVLARLGVDVARAAWRGVRPVPWRHARDGGLAPHAARSEGAPTRVRRGGPT
jgi:ATP-dependent Clp protease ATP-binding subunit ClpA